MKSPSQRKVSTISFLIALIVSLLVFGLISYFITSAVLAPKEEPEEKKPGEITEEKPDDQQLLTPDEIEKIKGESFTVLIAGYDLQGSGFDAMAVLDVNKEKQLVNVYPVNTDTKVYVGHGDTYSLNVRMGDLIKYKNMQYVLDKVNAVTGLGVEYYITFTAEGFIEAFDVFNKNGDYTYIVPKDMEHIYVEIPEEKEAEGEEKSEGDKKPEKAELPAELKKMQKYDIKFKKGQSLTSGIDIYKMLRYRGDSTTDRMNRQAMFVRDVIAKIIPARFKEHDAAGIVNMIASIKKLKSSINTNISFETFITETFDLILTMPEFSVGTVVKYTSESVNYN